jgi:hypothetical protein
VRHSKTLNRFQNTSEVFNGAPPRNVLNSAATTSSMVWPYEAPNHIEKKTILGKYNGCWHSGLTNFGENLPADAMPASMIPRCAFAHESGEPSAKVV